jgi:hypothetical protein
MLLVICFLCLIILLVALGAALKIRGHRQPKAAPDVPVVAVAVEQPENAPSAGTPALPLSTDEKIASILKRINQGEPTTFRCYGGDKRLFMLRLASGVAYVNSARRQCAIFGVATTNADDSMIIDIASISEHAAISHANRSGGPVEEMERQMFSKQDFDSLRPVVAYSNYALPGYTLVSLDGFNRCVAKLKTGTYTSIHPAENGRSETGANIQEAGAIVSAMAQEELKEVSLVDNFQTLKVRCNGSCKKEWSLGQCSDVKVREREILFRCPGCGRSCWQDRA